MRVNKAHRVRVRYNPTRLGLRLGLGLGLNIMGGQKEQ